MGLFRVFLLQSCGACGANKWDGWVGWNGLDLCAGCLYERRFAVLINGLRSCKKILICLYTNLTYLPELPNYLTLLPTCPYYLPMYKRKFLQFEH